MAHFASAADRIGAMCRSGMASRFGLAAAASPLIGNKLKIDAIVAPSVPRSRLRDRWLSVIQFPGCSLLRIHVLLSALKTRRRHNQPPTAVSDTSTRGLLQRHSKDVISHNFCVPFVCEFGVSVLKLCQSPTSLWADFEHSQSALTKNLQIQLLV